MVLNNDLLFQDGNLIAGMPDIAVIAAAAVVIGIALPIAEIDQPRKKKGDDNDDNGDRENLSLPVHATTPGSEERKALFKSLLQSD